MDTRIQLTLGVAASIVIGVVGLIAYRARGDAYWRDSGTGSLLAEIALFVYHIGLPFLALIAGSISLDLLGLGTDWSRGDHLAGFTLPQWFTGLAGAAGAVAFVLIALAGAKAPRTTTGYDSSGFTWLRDAIYDEAHWVLYRSPFVLLFDDLFFGALAGLALVGLEWIIRQRIAPRESDRNERMLTLLCALTSALLYITTQNLWLMIGAHIVARAVGQRLIPTTAPQPRAS